MVRYGQALEADIVFAWQLLTAGKRKNRLGEWSGEIDSAGGANHCQSTNKTPSYLMLKLIWQRLRLNGSFWRSQPFSRAALCHLQLRTQFSKLSRPNWGTRHLVWDMASTRERVVPLTHSTSDTLVVSWIMRRAVNVMQYWLPHVMRFFSKLKTILRYTRAASYLGEFLDWFS